MKTHLKKQLGVCVCVCVCVCFPPRTFTFSQAAQALGASNLVWQAEEPPETLLCWSGCLVIDLS